MKKNVLRTMLLAAGLILALAACGPQSAEPAPEKPEEAAAEPAEGETAAPADVDQAVALALLDQARSGYAEGECPAEGHAILGAFTNEDENTVEVYAQCSVGNYGFVSGNFEEISGSGAIPSRLTFARDENGGLTLTDFWQAEDGSRYGPSIRETFPAELADEALNTQAYYPALKEEKEAYARAYLEEIGRAAEIGEYADFDHPLAIDQGMSPKVSDQLMTVRWEYPFFLGNEERLEDGVRWVYSNGWTPGETDGEGTVTYTKTNYDTGEIAEQHVYQVTGDDYREIEAPES